MTLPARLRAVDDFLFDRVYQPIVDFAAPFDVKARHLSAGSFLLAGIMWYESRPLWSDGVLVFQLFYASTVLYWRPTFPRDTLRWPRLFFGLGGFILTTDIGWMLFNLFQVSGFYFSDCQNKPPKRRWWKELKRAIEALAWAPEVEAAEA